MVYLCVCVFLYFCSFCIRVSQQFLLKSKTGYFPLHGPKWIKCICTIWWIGCCSLYQQGVEVCLLLLYYFFSLKWPWKLKYLTKCTSRPWKDGYIFIPFSSQRSWTNEKKTALWKPGLPDMIVAFLQSCIHILWISVDQSAYYNAHGTVLTKSCNSNKS